VTGPLDRLGRGRVGAVSGRAAAAIGWMARAAMAARLWAAPGARARPPALRRSGTLVRSACLPLPPPSPRRTHKAPAARRAARSRRPAAPHSPPRASRTAPSPSARTLALAPADRLPAAASAPPPRATDPSPAPGQPAETRPLARKSRSPWPVATTAGRPSSAPRGACTRWSTPWRPSPTPARPSASWPRTAWCWSLRSGSRPRCTPGRWARPRPRRATDALPAPPVAAAALARPARIAH
jgi:hypothetical protein